MKVVLYGINYSPELTGIGKYTGEMARWLGCHGCQVKVVTAPPYYPDWKVQPGYSGCRWSTREEEGVSVTRCPLYVPKTPSALKRLIHLFTFALSSLLPLLAQARRRPDLVVLVAPTLFCAPGAWLLAKLSGARSVIHIQDYEVDAFFGLGMAKSGFLRRAAFACERFLLRAFDRVSTISSGMLRRAEEKGVSAARLLFFPNWSETGRFQSVDPQPGFLQKLGVPEGRSVVLYSGNIGEKQGLEQLIEAADRMQSTNPELFFLIVGEGAGKQRLVAMALEKGLTNLGFAPLQPYDDLPTLLASAQVHLVIQRRGAADAVLPSKLTNILAVGGNAVITADPETTLGLLCEQHEGIATLVEPELTATLVSGIELALAKASPNSIATSYAKEYLDKDRVLARFVDEVNRNLIESSVSRLN